MNWLIWLIWISGWYWGLLIIIPATFMIQFRGQKTVIVVNIVSWTMTWIWICWKFIR